MDSLVSLGGVLGLDRKLASVLQDLADAESQIWDAVLDGARVTAEDTSLKRKFAQRPGFQGGFHPGIRPWDHCALEISPSKVDSKVGPFVQSLGARLDAPSRHLVTPHFLQTHCCFADSEDGTLANRLSAGQWWPSIECGSPRLIWLFM